VTGDGERLDEVSATLRRATEQRVGKRDLRQGRDWFSGST
jgi:hypothetical protein